MWSFCPHYRSLFLFMAGRLASPAHCQQGSPLFFRPAKDRTLSTVDAQMDSCSLHHFLTNVCLVVHLLTERATFSSLGAGCLSSCTFLKTYWLVNVTACVQMTRQTRATWGTARTPTNTHCLVLVTQYSQSKYPKKTTCKEQHHHRSIISGGYSMQSATLRIDSHHIVWTTTKGGHCRTSNKSWNRDFTLCVHVCQLRTKATESIENQMGRGAELVLRPETNESTCLWQTWRK